MFLHVCVCGSNDVSKKRYSIVQFSQIYAIESSGPQQCPSGVNTLVGFVMFVKHAQEYLLQKFLLHSVAFWRKDSPKLENTWGWWGGGGGGIMT